MADLTTNRDMADLASPRPHLDARTHPVGAAAFLLVLAAGLLYADFSISGDITSVAEHNLAI